jgi:hypothetical protein
VASGQLTAGEKHRMAALHERDVGPRVMSFRLARGHATRYDNAQTPAVGDRASRQSALREQIADMADDRRGIIRDGRCRPACLPFVNWSR